MESRSNGSNLQSTYCIYMVSYLLANMGENTPFYTASINMVVILFDKDL
jgi:hypothetical protein